MHSLDRISYCVPHLFAVYLGSEMQCYGGTKQTMKILTTTFTTLNTSNLMSENKMGTVDYNNLKLICCMTVERLIPKARAVLLA